MVYLKPQHYRVLWAVTHPRISVWDVPHYTALGDVMVTISKLISVCEKGIVSRLELRNHRAPIFWWVYNYITDYAISPCQVWNKNSKSPIDKKLLLGRRSWVEPDPSCLFSELRLKLETESRDFAGGSLADWLMNGAPAQSSTLCHTLVEVDLRGAAFSCRCGSDFPVALQACLLACGG